LYNLHFDKEKIFMRAKNLFRVFVLLAVLISALGTGQQAFAQSGTVQIVTRSLTYWDSIYTGYVDTSRYEKWPLTFDVAHDFTVTATPTSGALSPVIVLLDSGDNEIARATGSLTSSQPVGSYYILIQPETSVGGTYSLTIREAQTQTPTPTPTSTVTPTPETPTPTVTPTQTATPVPTNPFVSVTFNPTSVEVDGTSTGIVSLGNVPASGYNSVEFTCTYDTTKLEVSNIVTDTDLFGADPVAAVNGPQSGSFIVAMAGSNGHKVVADGAAFTFSAKGLAVGQLSVECRARVSTGTNTLTEIDHTPGSLTVTEVAVTNGTLTGKVLACKAVTVTAGTENVTVGTDGSFSWSAPAGSYSILAKADGFLSAQGSATLTSGNTTTLPQISLSAGDIDGNGVIDQYDAMTIGMSYNTSAPSAADLNCDSTINVLDLELLAGNYRMTGPVAWQ
jgi:hypothetical protein